MALRYDSIEEQAHWQAQHADTLEGAWRHWLMATEDLGNELRRLDALEMLRYSNDDSGVFVAAVRGEAFAMLRQAAQEIVETRNASLLPRDSAPSLRRRLFTKLRFSFGSMAARLKAPARSAAP